MAASGCGHEPPTGPAAPGGRHEPIRSHLGLRAEGAAGSGRQIKSRPTKSQLADSEHPNGPPSVSMACQCAVSPASQIHFQVSRWSRYRISGAALDSVLGGAVTVTGNDPGCDPVGGVHPANAFWRLAKPKSTCAAADGGGGSGPLASSAESHSARFCAADGETDRSAVAMFAVSASL